MADGEFADHSAGRVLENHSLLPQLFEEVFKKGIAYTADWRQKAFLAAPVVAMAAAVVVTRGRVLEEAAALGAKEGVPDIASAAETIIGQTGPGTEDFWREALAQIKVPPKS